MCFFLWKLLDVVAEDHHSILILFQLFCAWLFQLFCALFSILNITTMCYMHRCHECLILSVLID